MTDAPRRTKKELAALEQRKATAFRQGGVAYKDGLGVESNPYEADETMCRAWLRGWDSEKRIRTEINPRERRA